MARWYCPMGVTGIKGIGGLEFSGAIQGMRIQPSLLAQGKFPIIGIDSLAVGVKGDLFGGKIDAQLLGGVLKLDSAYNIIGTGPAVSQDRTDAGQGCTVLQH